MKLSQVPLSAVLSNVSPTTIHCTFEPALKSFFSVADDRPLNDYSVIDVDRWKSEVKIGSLPPSWVQFQC